MDYMQVFAVATTFWLLVEIAGSLAVLAWHRRAPRGSKRRKVARAIWLEGTVLQAVFARILRRH